MGKTRKGVKEGVSTRNAFSFVAGKRKTDFSRFETIAEIPCKLFSMKRVYLKFCLTNRFAAFQKIFCFLVLITTEVFSGFVHTNLT